MKKSEIKRRLEESLPYPRLTIRADQRFDAVCGMLEDRPARKEGESGAAGEGGFRLSERDAGRMPRAEEAVEAAGPTRAHRGRTVLKFSFSAAALVLVSLLVLNLTFPTVAESLPGLGEVFKTLNGKRAVGTNLSTYEDAVQAVDVTEKASRCSLTVQEAYSEGKYLFLGLRLDSEDEEVRQAAWLSTGFSSGGDSRHDMAVTVNGKPAELYKEAVFVPQDGYFQSAAVAVLPEPAAGGESLEVQLEINALRGRKQDSEFLAGSGPDVELTEPVSLSFTIEADTAHNRSGASGITEDSITFESFASTPAAFEVTVSYPLFLEGEVAAVEAYLEDGTELGIVSHLDSPPEGARAGDPVTHGAVFDGVPEGTEQVIVQVRNISNNGCRDYVNGGVIGSGVFAEFTVDLETGEVTPTETYLGEGWEHLSLEEYAAAWKAGPQYRGHIFVEVSSYSSSAIPGAEEGVPLREAAPHLSLFFTSDIDGDLPLEARFTLDGEPYLTVPVYHTEESAGHVRTEGIIAEELYRTETENYFLSVYDTTDPEEWITSNIPESQKRSYSLIAYAGGPEDMDETDLGSYWASHDMQVQLVNTVTGEVLYDSTDRVPSLCPDPRNPDAF